MSMEKLIRSLIAASVPGLLASCASLGDVVPITAFPAAAEGLPIQFDLLCWNVHKDPGALSELAMQGDLPDLICLQEWSGDLPVQQFSDKGYGGVFARSWRAWLGAAAGVATFSRVEPDRREAVISWWREFWVGTPKCSLVTRYRLGGGGGALLVVNVHALNFQVLTYMLHDQMQALGAIVGDHEGPVIVCGDFNTWSRDRLEVVRSAFPTLSEVEFVGLRATSALGESLAGGWPDMPLDRVFHSPCLKVVGRRGRVRVSRFSDHSQLLVTFRR